MSILVIFLSVLFYVLLGTAYVKGYDFVKSHSPGNLAKFYLILAVIRILLVATIVAVYVLLSKDREDSIHFSAMFLGMYVVTMVVTLILKH